VVGDFDSAEIRPLLEEMFADWQPGQEYARLPKEGRIKLEASRQEILTPDKENAVYFAATVMPLTDADPDYAGLVIGADIFGGSGLSSRLGDRVRQEEGLSYGVGAFFTAQSLDPRSTLGVYAITNPMNITRVEDAISEELQRLLNEGISAEELAAAQGGYLERQKIERSDDANLALVLNNTLEADRDMSYYADLEERIVGLTAEDVNEVLRRNVDPQRLPHVVAGDFEKVRAGSGN
jgi:zinc protease